MIVVPDAPWIRGEYDDDLPDIPDPVCPICGSELPETIYLVDGQVVGCAHCVEAQDADAWAEDKYWRDLEAERDRD